MDDDDDTDDDDTDDDDTDDDTDDDHDDDTDDDNPNNRLIKGPPQCFPGRLARDSRVSGLFIVKNCFFTVKFSGKNTRNFRIYNTRKKTIKSFFRKTSLKI